MLQTQKVLCPEAIYPMTQQGMRFLIVTSRSPGTDIWVHYYRPCIDASTHPIGRIAMTKRSPLSEPGCHEFYIHFPLAWSSGLIWNYPQSDILCLVSWKIFIVKISYQPIIRWTELKFIKFNDSMRKCILYVRTHMRKGECHMKRAISHDFRKKPPRRQSSNSTFNFSMNFPPEKGWPDQTKGTLHHCCICESLLIASLEGKGGGQKKG